MLDLGDAARQQVLGHFTLGCRRDDFLRGCNRSVSRGGPHIGNRLGFSLGDLGTKSSALDFASTASRSASALAPATIACASVSASRALRSNSPSRVCASSRKRRAWSNSDLMRAWRLSIASISLRWAPR
jgi:hypothetical protein